MTRAPEPVVLRLATTRLRRHNRLAELVRLFGEPVQVDTHPGLLDPGDIVDRTKAGGASAVLAESYPGDLVALVRALHPVPVLRPLRAAGAGVHAGAPEERFVGYGLLREDGTVEPLPDGALAR